MTTQKQIVEILKTVDDPELNIDVWSLGLIYEIKINKTQVNILMTFTTPMCPYGPMLIDMIKEAITSKQKDIKKVELEITFDPAWEPSKELRAMFGV